jgi:hypothetical protein
MGLDLFLDYLDYFLVKSLLALLCIGACFELLGEIFETSSIQLSNFEKY